MTFTFDWSLESIKSCLYQRDRFTRWDFTKGFEAEPMQDAVLIDPARNVYATPVSGNRYLMIWQHDAEKNLVRPGYVFPKSYWGETPEELKAKVERIIPIESGGRYTLDGLFGAPPPAAIEDKPPPVKPAGRKPGFNL